MAITCSYDRALCLLLGFNGQLRQGFEVYKGAMRLRG